MENYADRLTRWMRQEYGLDWLDQRNEGRDVREWIPVTERLPEEGRKCLALLGDRYGWHGAIVYHCPEEPCSTGWFTWDGDLEICGVTHWMPWPEPPK